MKRSDVVAVAAIRVGGRPAQGGRARIGAGFYQFDPPFPVGDDGFPRGVRGAGSARIDVRRLADGTPVVLEVNARFGAVSESAPELLDAVLREWPV